MPDLEPHYRFREELVELVRGDLLGPAGGEDEVLDEEPLAAYITGVLHPLRPDREAERTDREEQDVDVEDQKKAEDGPVDSGIPMSNLQRPSAMGLTFSVDPRVAPTLAVAVRAARYEPVDAEGNRTGARRARRRATEEELPRWRRVPVEHTIADVRVEDGGTSSHLVDTGLELRIRRRPRDAAGLVALTVSLINSHRVPGQEVPDPSCWFQPTITVSTRAPALVDRGGPRPTDRDDELRLNALLHRHAPVFATGHGCAVTWDWRPPAPGAVPSDAARTDTLRTTFVPDREVLLTDSNPDIGGIPMLELAHGPTDTVLDRLDRLVTAYESWIDERRVEADGLRGTGYERVAGQRVAVCTEAADRMRSGIEALRRDGDALRAFRLANETMADQRARSAWVREGRNGEPDPSSARWRPFQVGFVLVCLDGIIDPDHRDRGITDLLWFPTGGGKTEAYLGLIAFTTYLRRLRRGPAGGGVTVLMRYTLRLLTLQQFERAATLICAMERTRRREPDLGDETISIGMWVGRAATPNKLDRAEKALTVLARNKDLQEENPVQLRRCPWCGTALDHQDHVVDRAAGRLHITCRDAGCDFRAGLAVHVVDETIYSSRPTLVIATSDKFAQMTWRGEVAGIFNRTTSPEGTPPPELVIQDELHLISGPLGTLAGLYEAAVDHAAARPKIIASTATIRRAEEQGRRLFDREVRQFPPSGLDARDSWFAVEATAATRATRRYLGVLAPATSQATLLIRTYAALLHHAHHIPGEDRVRDTYWTLVGYFTSLRLLSAAELQTHADVAERMKQLAVRDESGTRTVEILRELTSRIPSSDVPRRLEELFDALDDPDRRPIDVVLATNMISVGVDVDRLGLMAVMGQPQTTAEYIQATSRVGRRDPGLVVTMFNAARSRDRSHYENFVPYHSALYRQVESSSVTPFAPRARDRALHAVLVGMLRMTVPAARENTAAGDLAGYADEIDDLIDVLAARAGSVSGEGSGPDEAVADDLSEFVADWADLADGGPLLFEAPRRHGDAPREPDVALLRAYGADDDLDEAHPTMWSLRDVDVECPLYLET